MEDGPHRIRCANGCVDRIRLTRSHAKYWAEEHNAETGHGCTVSTLRRSNPVEFDEPAPSEAVDPTTRPEASTETVDDRG